MERTITPVAFSNSFFSLFRFLWELTAHGLAAVKRFADNPEIIWDVEARKLVLDLFWEDMLEPESLCDGVVEINGPTSGSYGLDANN